MCAGDDARAFCAGGDVASLAACPVGERQQFLRDEYALLRDLSDRRGELHCVAVADGITMGAGAGLWMTARRRFATERLVFAMPETRIGLCPDAGALSFLRRRGYARVSHSLR